MMKAKSENKDAPAAQPTARAMHLAANPKEAITQAALIAAILAGIREFKPACREVVSQKVKVAESARQIGIAVLELEELFPGKRLTEDFWRQIEGEFVDAATMQPITREMLLWFAKIARHHPEPITDVGEVKNIWQPMLLASGEPEFRLQGERAPQHMHAPPNPLTLLKTHLGFTRLQDVWNQLRADEHYFPGGKIRADLRDPLRIELAATHELLGVIWRDIGF